MNLKKTMILSFSALALGGAVFFAPPAHADGNGWNYGTGLFGAGTRFRISNDPANFCTWHIAQGRAPCEIICPCENGHPPLDLTVTDLGSNCPTISVMMNQATAPPSATGSSAIGALESGVSAQLTALQSSLGISAAASGTTTPGASALGAGGSTGTGSSTNGGTAGGLGGGFDTAANAPLANTTNGLPRFGGGYTTGGGTTPNNNGTASNAATAGTGSGSGFGGAFGGADGAKPDAAEKLVAQGAPGAALAGDGFVSGTAGGGGRAGYQHGTGDVGDGKGVQEMTVGGVVAANKGGIFELVSSNYRDFARAR